MTTRRSALHAAVAAALAVTAASGAARADEDLVCDERHSIDPWQLVRRLSLDLAGSAPTIEQLEAVDAVAGDEAALEQYLAELTDELVAGDGFRQATRRIHEAMLWPNIQNVRLSHQRVLLRPDDNDVLMINSNGRYPSGENCGNFRHTSFDPDFPDQFRPLPQNGNYGWREVTPYWAPDTTVKVCAFEAQEVNQAGGAACNTPEGTYEQACGCGAGLKFCWRQTSENDVRNALREQLLLAVDDATAEGADYTSIVLSTAAKQDGRISFWKRNLAPNVLTRKIWAEPDPEEEVLTKGYSDATWEDVERGPLHAGVLTLPGYLIKFQTGRGRVNRFRQAFQCQSFEPPATTEDEGCSDSSNDLTDRCTCRYCHSTLEPLAIGFERFAEAGSTLLAGAGGFPKQRDACAGSNSEFCKRFYVTGGPRAGYLKPLEFAAKHDDYEARFDAGPRRVVKEAIWEDGEEGGEALTGAGSFAGCAARRAFVQYLRRTPTLEEEETIDELATSFAEGGFDYRGLVRAVVTNDAYRRIR
jgi:hypothetical protein